MKIEEKHIIDFDGEYRPFNYCPPKEDGFYMTFRCGLGGIYTSLNEWKDGKWMMYATDASSVIAYSREPIPKEQVNAWAREKLNKYKNKKA